MGEGRKHESHKGPAPTVPAATGSKEAKEGDVRMGDAQLQVEENGGALRIWGRLELHDEKGVIGCASPALQ